MKKYIASIREKPAHERRTHAMQMSGALLVAIFSIWVSTLAFRLSTGNSQVAGSDNASQLANVASGAANGQATLLVATSSDNQP